MSKTLFTLPAAFLLVCFLNIGYGHPDPVKNTGAGMDTLKRVGAQQPSPNCDIIVLDSVSCDRRSYFKNKKYAVLNRAAGAIEANARELDEIIFNAIEFDTLLNNFLNLNSNGMRLYFGTRMAKAEEMEEDEGDAEDVDNAAKLVFVFTPTKDKGAKGVKADYDNHHYYVYKTKKQTFDKVCKCKAKRWVQNFQNGKPVNKRNLLRSTLTQYSANQKFDTKHIYFETCKLQGLKKYIEAKLASGKKTGVKMRLIAYTDTDLVGKYRQRLSVDFVFTNAHGNEESPLGRKTTLEQLIKEKFGFQPEKSRQIDAFFANQNRVGKGRGDYTDLIKIIGQREWDAFVESLDTGMPQPPPYNINGEALDFNNQ